MPSTAANGGTFLRRWTAAALCALALGTISACNTVGATNSVDISSARPIGADRNGALATLNAFRKQNGLPSVRYDPVLDKAAERQAKAMAARGLMSHTLDGRLPARVETYGYQWKAIAENLGYNYRSTPQVMTGWENSPGHRKNLLNPLATDVGFSAAVGPSGEPYWAMILGRRRG